MPDDIESHFSFAVLDQHVRPYFGPRSQEGLYICNACGSTQRSHSNMTNHVESKHLSLTLKCILCHGISKTCLVVSCHVMSKTCHVKHTSCHVMSCQQHVMSRTYRVLS